MGKYASGYEHLHPSWTNNTLKDIAKCLIQAIAGDQYYVSICFRCLLFLRSSENLYILVDIYQRLLQSTRERIYMNIVLFFT